MFVVCVFDFKFGEMVFDVCVVSGGKLVYIGELMENKGSVILFDFYKYKVKLIKEVVDRFGFIIIDVKIMDVRKVGEMFENG